jgi:hypothetical protein
MRSSEQIDEAQRGEWEAGRTDGYDWAQEEAERGYLHPLEPDASGGTAGNLLERVPHVFGGLFAGKTRPFLSGFLQGVGEFWREIKPPV